MGIIYVKLLECEVFLVWLWVLPGVFCLAAAAMHMHTHQESAVSCVVLLLCILEGAFAGYMAWNVVGGEGCGGEAQPWGGHLNEAISEGSRSVQPSILSSL